MADVHDKETRSYNMSRIKSKDTKPELIVRKFLFANGYRFRLHSKELPGKPDIVLAKYRTVIFVHGCFWHGHKSCNYFTLPKTRTKWWKDKISLNITRDFNHYLAYKETNWKVFVIWECQLKKGTVDKTLSDFLKKIITLSSKP